MNYHGIYEVDPAYICDGAIFWHGWGSVEYIIATKGGRKYLIRRYIRCGSPSKDLPKVVYDLRKAEADAFEKRLKQRLDWKNGLNWETDHILTLEDYFWDGDNQVAIITSLVPDPVPHNYDYSTLSPDTFLHLALQAAKALEALHAHDVIHGDVTERSMIVVKTGDLYTPYLADFDSSYPADDIPDWDTIGGSYGYQSPEVMLYGSDEGASPRETITPAADIFSLAIVFHKWWAGAFPGTDMENGLVGEAVYLGKAVTIHKKFNVIIGPNCGATLRSLLHWMLAKDPAARPTARQVADVLSDRLEVPGAFREVDADTPWPEHGTAYNPQNMARLGVKSISRMEVGGEHRYRIVYNQIVDGKNKVNEKVPVNNLKLMGFIV